MRQDQIQDVIDYLPENPHDAMLSALTELFGDVNDWSEEDVITLRAREIMPLMRALQSRVDHSDHPFIFTEDLADTIPPRYLAV